MVTYILHILSSRGGKRFLLSYLCGEPVEEGIPEVHQCKGKVFVKEVAEKLAHAIVRPAAMDQEEALKVAELAEGKVTAEHGLHPFMAADANPNVGSCNETPEIPKTGRLFAGFLPWEVKRERGDTSLLFYIWDDC